MKVKIVEIREVITELKPMYYLPDDRTPEKMLAVEKSNSGEIDYMDLLGASSDITFEVIEE